MDMPLRASLSSSYTSTPLFSYDSSSLSQAYYGLSNLPVADVLFGTSRTKTEVLVAPIPKNITKMAEKTKDAKSEIDEYCRIKMNYLTQLKDSTKKLLYIIDEIQAKTHSSRPISSKYDDAPKLSPEECPSKINDLIDSSALKNLEDHAKKLDGFYVENADDDCSVFKRLTRKCNCLNRKEYNDFIIHFNENTKYNTSNAGEIIKNVRILKKFLYMGDGYSNNALMFLNEGLYDCPHNEKVEIVTACSHADLCNVFDDHSFVIVFLLWPEKYDNFGNQTTQTLAAKLLYRIAIIEEGRRYLNYNSKITNDIKKVLRRPSTDFNADILEFLNSTMNLLSPSIAPHINATYYCKADEGMTNKIINSLVHFRLFMTVEEIINALDMLNKLSNTNNGRKDLQKQMATILSVFKQVLMENDNSEMNVLMTSTLNNLMTNPKYVVNDGPKTLVVCNIATEPILVKHEIAQMPSYKNLKKDIKSKLGSFRIIRNIQDSTKLRRRGGEGEASKNNIKTLQKPTVNVQKEANTKARPIPKPIIGQKEASKNNIKTVSKLIFGSKVAGKATAKTSDVKTKPTIETNQASKNSITNAEYLNSVRSSVIVVPIEELNSQADVVESNTLNEKKIM